MAVTDPERNSDDQNAGDEKTERRSVTDIETARVDRVGQSSERYKEQQQRRNNRLADTVRKHALVEELIELPRRVQFRIM